MALAGQFIMTCCALLTAPTFAVCSDSECKVDDTQALLQTRAERTVDDIAADLKSGRYKLDQSVMRKGGFSINSNFIEFENTDYARRDAIAMSLGAVNRCEGGCFASGLGADALQTGFGQTDVLFKAQGGKNVVVSPLIILDTKSKSEFHSKVDISALPPIAQDLGKGSKRLRTLGKLLKGGELGGSFNITSTNSAEVGFQEVHFDVFALPSLADEIKKEFSEIEPKRIRVVTAVLIAVTPFKDVASTCPSGSVSASIPDGSVTIGGSDCQGSTWILPEGGLFAYRTAKINGQGQLEETQFS